MAKRWKQGVAWVRVAAVVGATVLAGCSGAKSGPARAEVRATPAPTVASVMRVGVYESRAVAVAYGRSRLHARVLEELVKDHKAAVAAGDTAKAAELNKAGELQQMRLHLQAFSDAPVDDAMAAVREQLAGVMEKRGVSVLTAKADASAAGVELVDVTEDVVLLFEPDAATLRMVAGMKGKEALPIEQVARMPVGK